MGRGKVVTTPGPEPLTAEELARAKAQLIMANAMPAESLKADASEVLRMAARYLATIDADRRRIAELEAALRGLLPLVNEFEGSVYGGFMGGDPRHYTPDAEECTPEEIEAHAKACAEWDAGVGVDRGPGCQYLGDGSTLTGTGFGIGTTYHEVPEIAAARAALEGSRG